MAAITTVEEARAVLSQISPGTKFRLYPFHGGWVATPDLSQVEARGGSGLGLASDVVDAASGKIYAYPSWAAPMIADAHQEALRSGQLTAARQVYPHQWRLSSRKTGETDEAVAYQLTVTSLADPPAPGDEHPLTLDKEGHGFAPTDSMSADAASHLRWARDNRGGEWPESDETTL